MPFTWFLELGFTMQPRGKSSLESSGNDSTSFSYPHHQRAKPPSDTGPRRRALELTKKQLRSRHRNDSATPNHTQPREDHADDSILVFWLVLQYQLNLVACLFCELTPLQNPSTKPCRIRHSRVCRLAASSLATSCNFREDSLGGHKRQNHWSREARGSCAFRMVPGFVLNLLTAAALSILATVMPLTLTADISCVALMVRRAPLSREATLQPGQF
ncbi:hypothetical protein B0T14DRAFT_291413 [Immersiella caudata]|uniref:Uncharacterized protein n=1 Tax=Immersiella caudata TaxID=314043 RepID=A0AA39WEN7_9PEZI|nr:hypothetical protein B0T14DRAFT_291413 [Immersiella caudata]